MSWGEPPLIYDEEDEAALKARFVELSALHPNRTPEEIGRFIFKDLRDPGFRGEDAGMKWSRELDIIERIRLARLNGGREVLPELPPKEVVLNEILTLARDPRTDPKDAHALYRTFLETQGHIVKQEAKTIDKKVAPAWPVINFVQADFSQPAAEVDE